jgi:hypothetical protein
VLGYVNGTNHSITRRKGLTSPHNRIHMRSNPYALLSFILITSAALSTRALQTVLHQHTWLIACIHSRLLPSAQSSARISALIWQAS